MRDVNGSRYHLVLGKADWMAHDEDNRKWRYDPDRNAVTLQPEIFSFKQSGQAVARTMLRADSPIQPLRGVTQDRFGNWYWIALAEEKKANAPSETQVITRIYSTTHMRENTQSEPLQIYPVIAKNEARAAGSFQPVAPIAQETRLLSGLTVTADGYLIAGSPTTGGLLVFDLYAPHGTPLHVMLPLAPGGLAAEAYDLAALPDGGLLVLDRTHRIVWRLRSNLRAQPSQVAPTGAPDNQVVRTPLLFQPNQGARRFDFNPPTAHIELVGDSPVSITAVEDGTFWVLDTPDDGATASTLRHYTMSNQVDIEVQLLTANLKPANENAFDLPQIRATSVAYLPPDNEAEQSNMSGDGSMASKPRLFLVDQEGNQAYALVINPPSDSVTDPRLSLQTRFYPLRHYQGASLYAHWGEGEVYYLQEVTRPSNATRPSSGVNPGGIQSSTGTRWLPIKELHRPKYEESATLTLDSFDGYDLGCVWHRLCLDACIPPTTTITIEARTADNSDEVEWQPWQPQPRPYLRPDTGMGGSEVPYGSLLPSNSVGNGPSTIPSRQPDTGTWELLLQTPPGRYLQVRLIFNGDKRSTPVVRALRLHYPRFSYLKNYLPALYQQDARSMQFLENFLANPEGIFTTLEGTIAQVQMLMDVRTVPADALDWLASWVGLSFEPAWTEYQRRLLLAHAPYFYLRRGTMAGMTQAILIALCPELGPEIFRDDISHPTIRIIEQYLTEYFTGAIIGDPTAISTVNPTAVSEEQRTQLLSSTVRDQSIAGSMQPAGPINTDFVLSPLAERAHRFLVLVPHDSDPELLRLVERIIELEKPAHTAFSLKYYWAMLRVGEVRLGLDTRLGQGSRFEAFQLKRSALAEAALLEREWVLNSGRFVLEGITGATP